MKTSNNPNKYLGRADIEKGKNTKSYKEKIKQQGIKPKDTFSLETIDSNGYSKKKRGN